MNRKHVALVLLALSLAPMLTSAQAGPDQVYSAGDLMELLIEFGNIFGAILGYIAGSQR